MRTRTLALLLAAVMVLGLLAGCGSTAAPADSSAASVAEEPETPLPPIPVSMGTVDSVDAEPDGSCLLLLEKEKAAHLRQEVTLEESLQAPVEKGTQVGSLTAYAGDELLAEIPLLTASDVPRVRYGQMFFRVLRMAFLDD